MATSRARKQLVLFSSGRFDFVIFERERGGEEYPILAIELDGKEHSTDASVRERDEEKRICRAHYILK